MIIKFPIKLADRNIGLYVDAIYRNYQSNPKDDFHFDLSDTEYIGNQELLVLSGIFTTFIASDIEFKVQFLKPGVAFDKNRRAARQIIQFWSVWKIYQIAENDQFDKYFGINGGTIDRLMRRINYYPKLSEIYDRNGVTPFVILDYVENYNEKKIAQIIEPIYDLNKATEDILAQNKCHHPFTTKALSTIITEELYLNFLDHSEKSALGGTERFAFMSISFQDRMKGDDGDVDLQKRKSTNFSTEQLEATRSFFYDNKLSRFKNEPYITFSFLDFGQGVAKSLRREFKLKFGDSNFDNLDSEILKYAFQPESSRHPIFDEAHNRDELVSRGLFDALIIVQRYRGLMVVRSNFGKIYYDFSRTINVEEAFGEIQDHSHFFPGTLITIYLPAITEIDSIKTSSIKQNIEFKKISPTERKYLSINSLARRLNVEKKLLYTALRAELVREISVSNQYSLVFLNFKNSEWIDPRIISKTLEFLVSNYQINNRSNVIILNPPNSDLIDNISAKIHALDQALKNYKIHPLPLVRYIKEENDIKIDWLGVFNDNDLALLDKLLYEDYQVARFDFSEPNNIEGHLHDFDSYGNMLSNLPNRSELLAYFEQHDSRSDKSLIDSLLTEYKCFKPDSGKSLFLCNGNYYQREYIELNNLTNDANACDLVMQQLFDRICNKIGRLDNITFLGVTTTSYKLLKSLERQRLVPSNAILSLDNYHDFENDLTADVIDSSRKYVLICDVVSTGYLTERIDNRLRELGSEILCVGVIVSTLDSDFDTTKYFLKGFSDKLVVLYPSVIKKFRWQKIKTEVLTKRFVRINPHTNIPITLSINDTRFNNSILFPTIINFSKELNEIYISNKLLDKINPKALNVGFLTFNNVIHPYFFNTDMIMQNVDSKILQEMFEKIGKPSLNKEKFKVFYPKKSGIGKFDFNLLKKVLKNQGIEPVEIERFGTPEGWRFPSNPEHLNPKIAGNICLILDDGTCSGDSLIQMIDEISFYNAKEIILLCVIGRVQDHKREFFSRLSSIWAKDNKIIPLSIYFASHWHIPTYYLDDNPLSKELKLLATIAELQNTPTEIRRIALNIHSDISPKPERRYYDYRYLPREKGTKAIPKKDLLLIREEVGKVIGYRLYKESFRFFDLFIKKYVRLKKTKHRYKHIELLCATFIYEPYLFDKLSNVMPDVIERIRSFVKILIFEPESIYDQLSYHWKRKDLIHLFFVTFKNEELTKVLNGPNFIKLAKLELPGAKYKDSPVNYLLFKLLSYFPISHKEDSIYSGHIKKILLDVGDDKELSLQTRSRIKIFSWFVSSLPSKNSFSDMITRLKSGFERIIDTRYHDDNIFQDKQIINSKLLEIAKKIRNGQDFNDDMIFVQTRYKEIAAFVKDILSFSSRFREFFIEDELWADLEQKEFSLRQIFGELTSAIYLGDFKGFDIGKRLDEVFVEYILQDSKLLKIFSSPNTINARQLLENQLNLIRKEYVNNEIRLQAVGIGKFDIPTYYTELIFRELFNNLRYIDTTNILRIYISKTTSNHLKIKIWNSIKAGESRKGGNSGQRILENLNSKVLDCYYRSFERGKNYLQIIKIKQL